MSDGKKYYCFCSSNCKYETMTKEQIMAAITQAVEGGTISDVDTGFVTKVKEKNGGSYVSFWVGTQAQYNSIANREQNCLYIITDETTFDDVAKTVEQAAADAKAAADAAAEATIITKHMTAYIENDEININDNGSSGYVLTKYSNGLAEFNLALKINNFPITEKMGNFYSTYGGFKRVNLEPHVAIESAPIISSITCEGVECFDSAGKLRNVGGFVMTGGTPTTTATQNFLVLSNESVTATVYLNIRLMWKWKDGEANEI